MPLKPTPRFQAIADKMFEIPQPAIGGLNLKDLEYEQDPNQSPYMKNMMYRNGAFSKRYGQEAVQGFEDTVNNAIYYKDHFLVHCGTEVYEDGELLASNIADKKGVFALFNQKLYYICDEFYEYDGTEWEVVEPYIPDIVINRHADPADNAGDLIEPYNILGTGFRNTFDGDGTSTDFTLTDKELDEVEPSARVDEVELVYGTDFTVNYETGVVTFTDPPSEGVNNVEIVAYKKDDEWVQLHERVLSGKYYAAFGGNNNSRLFLAGSGNSVVYYSEVADASYFPYRNWIAIGNSAEDITGFGHQYNVLIVFKPNEIFSLRYYINTESTTTSDSQVGLGAFSSMAVNNAIGCDCPDSIQLINSQLTWLNSKYGVCTLVSTNIQDERNVRTLSRNIDHSTFVDLTGLLDWEHIDEAQSCDFDGKYFLANPYTGECFVWDYVISPFSNTGRVETDAKRLDWFLFDGFYVQKFITQTNDLLYISSSDVFKGQLIKVNETFRDLDYNQDGEPDAIDAFYMTPFLQFGAVAYLKNVKNIYVQCRADTASVIDMAYYTEESVQPEEEADSIRIGGRLWKRFAWDNFQWIMVNWASTFRRKCSLKKIQMAAFYFENDEVNRDMSISHIALQYSLVKTIK